MTDQDVTKQLDKLRGAISKQLRDSVNDIRLDALYQQLLMTHVFKRPEPLAAMTGWSIAPEFGWWLYNYVMEKQPRKVVEFGSGVSTLIMASAMKTVGVGRIISFESDLAYCQKTEALLALCGVSDFAKVVYAPLKKFDIGEEAYRWYDVPFDLLDVVIGADGIDLMLIDGPPKATNFHARYPAYPLLRRYCHDQTMIILDDAAREEECQILERWLAEAPEEFVVERLADIRHGPALFFLRSTVKDAVVSKFESLVVDNPILDLIVAELKRLEALGVLGLERAEPLELSFTPLAEAFYFHRESAHQQLKLERSQSEIELVKLQGVVDRTKATSDEYKKAKDIAHAKSLDFQNELNALELERDQLAILAADRELLMAQQLEFIERERVYQQAAVHALQLQETLRGQADALSEEYRKAQDIADAKLLDVQSQFDALEMERDQLAILAADRELLMAQQLDFVAREHDYQQAKKQSLDLQDDLRDQLVKLKSELKSARSKRNQYRDALEDYASKYSGALSTLERTELQNKLAELKDLYYRSSLNYQAARVVKNLLKSPLGLAKLPLALLRVLRRYKAGKPKRAAILDKMRRNKHRLKSVNFVPVPVNLGGKKSVSKVALDDLSKQKFEAVNALGAVPDICKIANGREKSHALFKTVLRTGSLQGRNLLAYLASQGRFDAQQLVSAIEVYRSPALKVQGRRILSGLSIPWALQFARVMAAQGFEADDELNALTLMLAMLDIHGAKSNSTKPFLALVGALAVSLGRHKDLGLVLTNLKNDSLPRQFLRIDYRHPKFGGNPNVWLSEINRFLQPHALEPITLDGKGDSFYSRIVCQAAAEIHTGPLVTVIITAWQPDECLLQALRSILDQSWRNLEVLVVDDASAQEFMPVFDACKVLDERVRVIHQPFNQGTYQARNAGLRLAQGKYVTFQDSDDWSHPRRVELQVEALEGDKKLISCHSFCLRVSEELVFSKPERPIYTKNTSSLMFRRAEVLESIGYMDAVRKGADTEYGLRMEIFYGEGSSCEIQMPLAFIRLAAGSLSRDEFRYGWHHPARLAYKNIYRYWHELIRSGQESAYLDGSVAGRKFAAPLRFQVDKEASRNASYDVVFIGDWRSYGGPQKSMIEEIKALHGQGMKVGICMLEAYRFMTNAMLDLCQPVTELIYNGIVEQVVPDDRIAVRLAILRYPPILQWIPHGALGWTIESAWVIANQAPHERDGRDVRYNVSDCVRNARHMFGQDPLWLPQGPQVRQALAPLLPAALLASYDDPGIINVAEWQARRQGWCANIPVVGRYSRDNQMKFPASVQEMSAAYMAGQEVTVRIMGGEQSLPTLFSDTAIPTNWEVLPYGAMPVLEFLSTVDFFVYFDNEFIVEAFGRSILEAIASGVVVILPPHFREVFGDAAVYCEPSDVHAVVTRFYASRALYDAQIELAMECLNENFSYEAFYRRVAAVVDSRA